MTNTNQIIPKSIANLQAAYGAPSQAAFGSAVFYEALAPDADLEPAALARYRYFVGELWERYGEAAWLGPWREVYARPVGAKPDIVAELKGITDPNAALSAPMLLDNDAAALAAVFDDPALTELRVFSVGDGGAMSGLLLSGRLPAAALFLVFLMD
jgi:hypothetical protein